MGVSSVRNYYDAADEWSRLDTPAGRLEFRRALDVLDRHLPGRSRVLDVGGGPGRYTIALAERGHRVTLVDLTPRHVDLARQKMYEHGVADQVERIDVGDICDLIRCQPEAFDAVVAFGPFYHLVRENDRRESAREIARVLRPGGAAFVQFIPRSSGLADLISRAAEDPAQAEPHTVLHTYETGVYHNPVARGFQEGYYAEAEELIELFERYGISRGDVLSLCGIACGREDKLAQLAERRPDVARAFDEVLEKTSRDRPAMSMGGRAIFIGHKKTPDD